MTDRPAAGTIVVRPIAPGDRAWLAGVLDARWGGRWQAYGGELVDAGAADGFLAIAPDGARAGFALHRVVRGGLEIVLLEAFVRGHGIGTALVDACAAAARGAGLARLEVVTTNDNVDALRFYQRRDFRLAELRSGAVDDARARLKPGIPRVGEHGIALRDELVLHRVL